MSLINQALRKAQRDRTPDRMADPGSTAPGAAALSGSSGMKPGLIIGLIVVVAVLIGLVAGLSIVLFKGSSAPAKTTAQVANTQVQAPTPVPTPITASPSATATPEPVAASTEKIEPVAPQTAGTNTLPLEREETPAVVDELRKAREAAEAKLAAEAKAAEEAAAKAAAKPSQDIIDWLSLAQVSGVKLSETESKVILNGDAYAVGEYVNYALGLKVMIIQEKRILFVDDNGKKYLKRL